MTRPDSSGGLIRALPLLLQRGQERELRPHIDTLLQLGDRVLCCGQARARSTMRRNITAHELPETLMGPLQPVSLRRKGKEQQAA